MIRRTTETETEMEMEVQMERSGSWPLLLLMPRKEFGTSKDTSSLGVRAMAGWQLGCPRLEERSWKSVTRAKEANSSTSTPFLHFQDKRARTLKANWVRWRAEKINYTRTATAAAFPSTFPVLAPHQQTRSRICRTL